MTATTSRRRILFDLAEDVILHRIRVSYEASAAGHTGKQVLEGILAGLG